MFWWISSSLLFIHRFGFYRCWHIILQLVKEGFRGFQSLCLGRRCIIALEWENLKLVPMIKTKKNYSHNKLKMAVQKKINTHKWKRIKKFNYKVCFFGNEKSHYFQRFQQSSPQDVPILFSFSWIDFDLNLFFHNFKVKQQNFYEGYQGGSPPPENTTPKSSLLKFRAISKTTN